MVPLPGLPPTVQGGTGKESLLQAESANCLRPADTLRIQQSSYAFHNTSFLPKYSMHPSPVLLNGGLVLCLSEKPQPLHPAGPDSFCALQGLTKQGLVHRGRTP
jgi:hypothetical protein